MTPWAKKSLGQHFLTSPHTVNSLIAAGEVTPDTYVVEIGPGTGVLTQSLLHTGARVHAIEKDIDLIRELTQKFQTEIEQGQLSVAHEDILSFNGTLPGTPETYTVVANIPYYITGAILRTFLTLDKQPAHMALLVQKEIAERIVSKDNKESILSLSVKLFGEPRFVKKVKPGAFSPPPKVDSAILAITNIGRSYLKKEEEGVFFDIVHAGFKHKRKQFLKNIDKSGKSRQLFLEVFSSLDLSDSVRAEDIPFETWVQMTKIITHRQGK